MPWLEALRTAASPSIPYHFIRQTFWKFGCFLQKKRFFLLPFPILVFGKEKNEKTPRRCLHLFAPGNIYSEGLNPQITHQGAAMIRGAQKRMIVIRTHDSRVFEEAYFVMRRDSEMAVTDSDMLSEADRIIRRSAGGWRPQEEEPHKNHTERPCLRRLGWLLAGFFLGSGGVGLLWWLL